MATVCPLCHQVFHLSSASITEGGEIIWLPEMTQEDLNRLCIAIFIAEKSGNKKWEGPAKRLFNALNSRAEFVNNSLSDKASDPGVFAETLLNLSKEEYKGREKFVKNLTPTPAVHGDIRRLEKSFQQLRRCWSVHGDIRRLETQHE